MCLGRHGQLCGLYYMAGQDAGVLLQGELMLRLAKQFIPLAPQDVAEMVGLCSARWF